MPNGMTGTRASAQSFTIVGDLGFGLGEQDGVGRLALEPGERVGVLLAKRLAQREALAEARGKVGEERRLALRRGAFLSFGHDYGHGPIL